jgi:CRISPR system Cascade subunit CasC
MVSISDLPISLANAFEAPVPSGKDHGFTAPSIDKLHEYWQDIHRGYGVDERCAEFVLRSSGNLPIDGLKPLHSLPELEDWLKRDGQE